MWKKINNFNYEISDKGEVRNHKNKIMKESYDKDNYAMIKLYKNGVQYTKKIHRLVAEAFIPNPNNYPQVNHKDEDKLNNSVDNLEWCTAKYNANYGTRIERDRFFKITNRNIYCKKTLCIETGELFDSALDASKKYNINVDSVRQSANPNNKRKTASGYTFKYVEDFDA